MDYIQDHAKEELSLVQARSKHWALSWKIGQVVTTSPEQLGGSYSLNSGTIQTTLRNSNHGS
jgi:hypothetical protein